MMLQITFIEFFGLALKYCALKNNHSKECWLDASPAKLHTKVLKLARKHSKLLTPLKELHFMRGGAFPYSAELARTLDILQQSGMITRTNPYYDEFRPTWHNDSEKLIRKRVQEVFENDDESFKAFEDFVINGLLELQGQGVTV